MLALVSAAGLFAVFLAQYYGARNRDDVSAVSALLLVLIPNTIGVLAVVLAADWLRASGLDQTHERLDSIHSYLQRHVKRLAADIEVVDRLEEVAWREVFDSEGPIRMIANFATLPLQQGKPALRATLERSRKGHAFVLADPENLGVVDEIAKFRSNLPYANDRASVDAAIRNSIAHVIESLPDDLVHHTDKPIPGIEILLSSSALGLTAYWKQDAAFVCGLQCLVDESAPAPRIMSRGDSSAALREYAETVLNRLRDSSRSASVDDLLQICMAVRSESWRDKMREKICV